MTITPSFIARAAAFESRIAISDLRGSHTYDELMVASSRAAAAMLGGRADLAEARVAFLVPPSFEYVVAQWGIWRAGGVAVPLCMAHPRPELEYVINDCRPEILVATRETEGRLRAIADEKGIALLTVEELQGEGESDLPSVTEERPAMIVYTSGTTGGPKGVVTTHANIASQIESLVTAWQWKQNDKILLVLPLHHVHGIVNVLGCALWSGALCETMAKFDPIDVWQRFVKSNLTLFMAVPTVYAKLATVWKEATAADQLAWSAAGRQMRLMVSGSAALPTRLFELWEEISGHTLLERYGMTEIGMALSNPIGGPRLPGHVGVPLPGIEVRRVNGEGEEVADDTPGEIEVRGPGVFNHYWERPDATTAAFRDGWFRTGDVAEVDVGSYRILGRQSVDIIKTGGFKVSALEIEETLRDHPSIEECAVVGVPDEEWGERVAVAAVVVSDGDLTLDELRSWTKERLASYKAPTRLLVLDALPRNPMGKVTKPDLKELFEAT